MLEELTAGLRERVNLSEEQSEVALEAILTEDQSDRTISDFLLALADKGETIEEVTGFARVMRRHSLRIESDHPVLIDTAGTGGGKPTFNISTTAALVISACGVPVAKHGNRAITSKSGSADVLRELGVKIDRSPAVSERALREIGICFLFAPLYHPAMKRVAQIRKKLGRKTIFNLLGPLTNPATAPYQVIGVFAPDLTEKLALALQRLGSNRAWVVHSLDGLDEVSVSADSRVSELRDGGVASFNFKPMETKLGVPTGGTPAENARLIQGILDGTITGPARDIVALNAAAAIHVASEDHFSQALSRAEQALEDGSARRKLEELKEAYA